MTELTTSDYARARSTACVILQHEYDRKGICWRCGATSPYYSQMSHWLSPGSDLIATHGIGEILEVSRKDYKYNNKYILTMVSQSTLTTLPNIRGNPLLYATAYSATIRIWPVPDTSYELLITMLRHE